MTITYGPTREQYDRLRAENTPLREQLRVAQEQLEMLTKEKVQLLDAMRSARYWLITDASIGELQAINHLGNALHAHGALTLPTPPAESTEGKT